MRAVLLASVGALLTLSAAGANPKVICSTEPTLGIADSQSLQYTAKACMKNVCTTAMEAREKNTSFTEQCGLTAFTITSANPALPPDVEYCLDYFTTIVEQCIAVEHVQGGAVSSDNVTYTVSTWDTDKRSNGPTKHKEELDLAVQRSTALHARQPATQPRASAPPSAKSTKLATQPPKPATKSTPQPTISTAIRAKPTKSPSKCKPTERALGTCKAKRFVVKRTSTLAELYKKIPAAHKVTTGNIRMFDVDNTKEVAFGATECIGCSVVIAVNGKQIAMGHYAEETGNPPVVTVESTKSTQQHIIEKMQKELDSFEEGANGHAWLIHSSRQPKPAGAKLWKEYMEESTCIPATQAYITQYIPMRVVQGGLEKLPNGKIVVTVTPQANGEAIITLYSNSDTPKWSQRYDSCGAPC